MRKKKTLRIGIDNPIQDTVRTEKGSVPLTSMLTETITDLPFLQLPFHEVYVSRALMWDDFEQL